MATNDLSQPIPWRRSRYGFAAFWFLSLLIGWTVLRLVLFFSFKPAGLPLAEVLSAFLSGLHRDVFAALLATLPLLGWMWIMPDRSWGATWHRVLFLAASVLFAFILIFLLFVEFFFFEEFKSRYNTVAVDYLIYPQEVFVNIWESYHIVLILLICLVLSVGWMFMASRLFAQMWERPFSAKARLAHLAAVAALAALLALTFNLKGARVSN